MARTNRELAIDRELDLVVEAWIEDDMDEANLQMQNAYKYHHMTDERFDKKFAKTIKKELKK